MTGRLRLWSYRWPHALMNALLPCSCALCGETAGAVVCPPCQRDHAAPGGARCPCCANPLGAHEEAGQRCAGCIATAPQFDATLAAADYAAPLDSLVLRLKFGAQLPLAP